MSIVLNNTKLIKGKLTLEMLAGASDDGDEMNKRIMK